eukprot:6214349-Pleurochrysis_carterae.AAC.3
MVLVRRCVGAVKCVSQSEQTVGVLTVRLCKSARRGATNGVCIVSVLTAVARLSGESGEAGDAVRGVDACAADAAAGEWAADASACACVLCGVCSTDETDVCIEGTGLCIDQTRHKMQTNLRAALCRVMNARARVKSVAERTCAGR